MRYTKNLRKNETIPESGNGRRRILVVVSPIFTITSASRPRGEVGGGGGRERPASPQNAKRRHPYGEVVAMITMIAMMVEIVVVIATALEKYNEDGCNLASRSNELCKMTNLIQCTRLIYLDAIPEYGTFKKPQQKTG